MPLYEYYCPECNQKFEALRRMDDADAPIGCKQCQGQQATRVLSLFATISSSAGSSESSQMMSANFGGCCGGSCGCSH